jgi:hypothetical protein
VASVAFALAGISLAQQQGGGQGGQGGGQPQQFSGGLPFAGTSQALPFQTQFQTANSGAAPTNVLGGYYANPLYQGQIGTSGGQAPGGFGTNLYPIINTTSTGSTGGAGGFSGGAAAGGARTGANRQGTQTGARTGTTGATGARTGSTGAAGTGFGSTNVMSLGAASGGAGGGFGGGRGGQLGGLGGLGGLMGGRTGMGGTTNASVITQSDRPVAAVIMFSGPTSRPAPQVPASVRAEADLRAAFDRSQSISTAKSIVFQVAPDGTTVLRGTVSNSDERRLAEGLARITPGVRNVVNELTIQPAP